MCSFYVGRILLVKKTVQNEPYYNYHKPHLRNTSLLTWTQIILCCYLCLVSQSVPFHNVVQTGILYKKLLLVLRLRLILAVIQKKIEKVKKREKQEEFPRLFRFLVFPSILNRNIRLFPWRPFPSFNTILSLSSVFHSFYTYPSSLLPLVLPFCPAVWKERKNHMRRKEIRN